MVKINFRTDLAIERREVSPHTDDGLKVDEYTVDNVKITAIEVLNKTGEAAIQKPKGNYITIETEKLDTGEMVDKNLAKVVAGELEKILPNGSALVCGIGNSHITPDALGPDCISHILATRHIGEELAKMIGFDNLRSVTAISPGVLGQTGIETGEIIRAVIDKTNPDFVIAVDALASRKLSRLGRTIQIADTGIIPGGGVANSRNELSKKTLGVPVISIGVPTVVDANTLVNDIADNEIEYQGASAMIVTPKEIDLLISHSARLISHSINCALQPDIDEDSLLMLTD
ncbi:MAG: GPR endopeptidase [Acutalibacteraceae bacterium]